MPTLNVSGIDGGITMEYKRDKNQWQGIFTATGAGTINIQMNEQVNYMITPASAELITALMIRKPKILLSPLVVLLMN